MVDSRPNSGEITSTASRALRMKPHWKGWSSSVRKSISLFPLPQVQMEYLLELGRGQHLVRRAHLEHLALEEDHLVGELAQGGEVVGGQEDGQVVSGADLVQHVHHLLLPVNVHAGEGLVQHQDVGQGSSARASSTRCSSPPDRAPIRRSSSPSP